VGSDIDVWLLDDQGNVLAEDTFPDNYPVVRGYCPTERGAVRIRVKLAASNEPGAQPFVLRAYRVDRREPSPPVPVNEDPSEDSGPP
jgi:hypothetical protein